MQSINRCGTNMSPIRNWLLQLTFPITGRGRVIDEKQKHRTCRVPVHWFVMRPECFNRRPGTQLHCTNTKSAENRKGCDASHYLYLEARTASEQSIKSSIP